MGVLHKRLRSSPAEIPAFAGMTALAIPLTAPRLKHGASALILRSSGWA
jgi:hypothetical protein